MVMLLQAQLARVSGRYEDALEIARHVLDVTADPAQHASALRTITTESQSPLYVEVSSRKGEGGGVYESC